MRGFLSVLLIGLSLSLASMAQDTIQVKHTTFTSEWVKSAGIPCLVSYTLNKGDLECKNAVGRKAGMTADPLVDGTNLNRDYKNSGYDKGHNMSSDDNRCNETIQDECFYFTNMFPQVHELNAGIWLALERKERQEATDNDSVVVFVGSYGKDKTIGPDKVFVPSYCWKVIYIPKLKEWDGYIFPNKNCSGTPDQWMNFTPDQRQWAAYLIRNYTRYKWR